MLRNNLSNKTTTTDTLPGNLWTVLENQASIFFNGKWRIKHLSYLWMYKLYFRIVIDEGKSLILGELQLINKWVICAMVSRVQLFTTLWNVAHQAPLSMWFSRQGYWSGLPFPPGDLPNPGFEPGSLVLQADSLLTDTTLVIHSKSYSNSTLVMFPLVTNQCYSHNNKSPTATWHYIKQDTQIPSSASYSHKTKKGKKGI